jgi:hypothetical protein
MVLRPNRAPARHALAAVTFSIVALFARRASADTTRIFELEWRAPVGCPTSGEVEREITRLIGAGKRNRSTVHAVAQVSGKDADWRVQIRIQDAENTSERTFDGATCRAVTKVAALIIALAIEPNAGSTPEIAAPSKDRPEGVPPPPPRAPEKEERPLRATLVLGPFANFALLPRAAWGFEVGAGLRWSAITVDVRGGAALPQSTEVPSAPAGGNFSLLTAGLRVCARVIPGATVWFVCATGLVDRITADGYGVTTPGSANALIGAAGLGPRIDVTIADAWRLYLAGEATYAFSEASFRLDNVGNVHRTARFGGSARLGVAWLF